MAAIKEQLTEAFLTGNYVCHLPAVTHIHADTIYMHVYEGEFGIPTSPHPKAVTPIQTDYTLGLADGSKYPANDVHIFQVPDAPTVIMYPSALAHLFDDLEAPPVTRRLDAHCSTSHSSHVIWSVD